MRATDSRRKVQKSKADTADLVRLNSSSPWASRWIHRNSRVSFKADHSKAHLVREAHHQVATKRLLCGMLVIDLEVSSVCLLFSRMGELEPWIDENFVRSVWFGMGYQVNVKMIRDKFSGYAHPLCSSEQVTDHG